MAAAAGLNPGVSCCEKRRDGWCGKAHVFLVV